MTKNVQLAALLIAGLLHLGCQKVEDSAAANMPNPNSQPTATITPKPASAQRIDVPKLARKPPEEFDKIFGKPEKITPATIAKEIPGEYRLYPITGNAKGLSVRFYRGKAVRFNLILEKPFSSAQDALLQTFNIDVKNTAPTIDKNEPLSQKWRGEFSGARFATVYAKKDAANRQFVMVHAEIAP